MNAVVEKIERSVSPELVDAFRKELAKLPQMELVTQHHFADGMYARVCHLPAGTLFVGKVQKKEHFFMITKGFLDVWHEGGIVTMIEGAIVTASPGSRRVGICWEDTIAVTIHRTDKTDLDEIEAETIVPDDELCFYDARNKLKPEFLSMVQQIEGGQ